MTPPTVPPDEHGDDWRHTLAILAGIQVIMTIAVTFQGPITPLILPELGVTSETAIGVWTGIIAGSLSFVATFASPIWGVVADRFGRKAALLRSSFAIAIFTALMGLSANVWQFFGARLLLGAFVGYSATAIAIVASQVPESRIGWALGWLSTGQIAGSLIGPVLAGTLSDLTGSYRVPFFAVAGSTFVGFLLITWLVWEPGAPAADKQVRQSAWAGLRGIVAVPDLMSLFLVLLMAQFSTRAVEPVVTLFVQDLVGDTATIATLAGLAVSATPLANVLATPVMAGRGDRIGHRRMLLIGLAGSTVAAIPQIWAENYGLFLAQRFGMGVFIGSVLPTAHALIGSSVPRAVRASVYGMTASATFLGSFLGPLTGGVVTAYLGIRWTFAVTAGLLALNLLWVWFVVRDPPPNPAASD